MCEREKVWIQIQINHLIFDVNFNLQISNFDPSTILPSCSVRYKYFLFAKVQFNNFFSSFNRNYLVAYFYYLPLAVWFFFHFSSTQRLQTRNKFVNSIEAQSIFFPRRFAVHVFHIRQITWFGTIQFRVMKTHEPNASSLG